jgi:hypothetical protein
MARANSAARFDKIILIYMLVIHPFEIINTQPSCRYWRILLLGWYWIGGWKSNSE